MDSDICVVVSTYNGARYLPEQLDSLIGQTIPIRRIHIRDDGSTDGTRQIIEDYAARYGNVTYEFAENVGWRKSFVEALKACGGYGWYSFCDQDDYWLPTKLEAAIDAVRGISDPSHPVLYAGNVTVSDADLNPETLFNKAPSAIEALPLPQTVCQDGMAGGLTYVFNDRAREMLTSCAYVGSTGHDRLLMLICKVYGTVKYDFASYVLYRQHGSNVYGGYGEANPQSRFKRLKSYISSMDGRDEIAKSLLEIGLSGEREPDDECYLIACAKYKQDLRSRAELLFRKNLGAMSLAHDIKLRIKVLMGTY